MIRLSKPQILLLHEQLLEATGGSSGLRDEGMLDSALNAPFQTFGGKPVYPSLQAKAARLGFGLVSNHPFVDGNKRTGAHVMLVFLALNGVELRYEQQELIDVFLSVASDGSDWRDLQRWILGHE
mgnify:CR=1 FL=1